MTMEVLRNKVTFEIFPHASFDDTLSHFISLEYGQFPVTRFQEQSEKWKVESASAYMCVKR